MSKKKNMFISIYYRLFFFPPKILNIVISVFLFCKKRDNKKVYQTQRENKNCRSAKKEIDPLLLFMFGINNKNDSLFQEIELSFIRKKERKEIELSTFLTHRAALHRTLCLKWSVKLMCR